MRGCSLMSYGSATLVVASGALLRARRAATDTRRPEGPAKDPGWLLEELSPAAAPDGLPRGIRRSRWRLAATKADALAAAREWAASRGIELSDEFDAPCGTSRPVKRL